jgi:hypothetical protein
MKKLSLLLIPIFLISSTVRSEDSVLLNKGTPAPYTGFLVPRERINELRIESEEQKALIASYARSVDLYKKNEEASDRQVNILLERNDKLSKELTSTRSVSTFEKTAWFIGGILVSGAAVYGASKLAK